MNVGDSELFKTFARSTLQQHLNAGDEAGPARQPGIMDAIIQYLINRAKLDVSLVRINGATEDSFSITIESRVTRTGPMSSTISRVELDLVFNGSFFGKLSLPEVKTSLLWGTKVMIRDQRVEILDMAVFKAYIRDLIVNDETCFQLENGKCTIRSLGVAAYCDYCLDIPVRGMMGPKATLKTMKLEHKGTIMTLTVTVHNPSPLEIDYGRGRFELRNCMGETVAELTGDLNIVRGSFGLNLSGELRNNATPAQKVRLVGIGVDNDSSWCNDSIRDFDVLMELQPEFVSMLEEPQD